MTSFATIPCGEDDPLRVVAVGAGAMGRAWLQVVEASPEAQLVGIVDLDLAAARDAAVGLARPDLPVGSDVVEVARGANAQAVLDVTVPAAHHPITTAALFAGLPVLGEKPVADTLAGACSLAAAAELTGQLFMVSQSRRWNPHVAALRGLVEDLGEVGTIGTEFFRAPRFGGFRDEMVHPLLVDMAIHPFDTARFLLDADPVSVHCDAYNPPWSWYAGAANAAAIFEMEGGARYVFNGSWCAPGAETSWNGTWRISGERGTARWDGESAPTLDGEAAATSRPTSPYSDIAGALQVFCDALRTGVAPMGEVHENLMSLAMVEAAVASAETGETVVVDDVLGRALDRAVHDETNPQVRAAMEAWPALRSIVTPPAGAR